MSLFAKLRLRSHVRLFLVFILTFLIPQIILTTLFLSSYQDLYGGVSQQSSCRQMDTVASTIDSQFQSIATYLSMLCRDADLNNILMATMDDSCENKENPDLRSVSLRYSASISNQLNSKIIILNNDGKVLMGQECIPSSEVAQKYIRILETTVRSPIKSTLWFSSKHIASSNNAYIYAARSIRSASNWEVIGYVILRFQTSDVVSMYLNASNPFRSIFVVDSSGDMVSSIDNLTVNDTIIEPQKRQLMLSNEALTIDGRTAYTNILCNQWYLISITETGATSQPEITTALKLYLWAGLLCVALTLLVTYITARRFTKPMSSLIDGMKKVESGDLHARVSIHTHDEFEDLADNYNKMIVKVEGLVRQVIFEQEQKRISDMKMLQAQINPHFLYNTLGSIRYMAYTSPPQDVDTMLLSLTKFLNYVLSGTEVYASLDRELEQMNHYITIQRFGFEVPLRYEVEIENNLGHCQIVKMLLQPLVENAVLHGLKLNPANPLLRICVSSADQNTVQIDISDNGPGFDTKLLSTKPEVTSPYHHHLGLANVRQRLWLHYGESYQLDITSRKGEGTTATICIPKLTEEDVRSENFNR